MEAALFFLFFVFSLCNLFELKKIIIYLIIYASNLNVNDFKYQLFLCSLLSWFIYDVNLCIIFTSMYIGFNFREVEF